MNEPAKKPDFTSNPQRVDFNPPRSDGAPRRVIELRCKEPLHINNEVRNSWKPGTTGSAKVTSMELLPMGVLVRSEAGALRKAMLVPFANVLWAGLEE